MQVHKLDAEAWKKTEVVYIDIGDRSQVDDKVSTLECLHFIFIFPFATSLYSI